MRENLFAEHHLVVEQEEYSLLTLAMRLRQLGQLPREDEIGASAKDVFTLCGDKHSHIQSVATLLCCIIMA